MKWLDQLPSVTTCCYCCFLRAGCICIAAISFTAGIILAPNVVYAKTPPLLPAALTATEATVQVLLGLVSILLCISSFLLFVGSFCNVPILIEFYEWGLLIYGVTTTVLYTILAYYCFAVHTNSASTGGWFTGLALINSYLTSYFVIVTNSLRMSILFIQSTELYEYIAQYLLHQ